MTFFSVPLLRMMFIVAIGLLTSSPAVAQIGYSCTTIDVPGSDFTLARGLNDTGKIVGQFRDGSGNYHGFHLSGIGGTFTTIDVPGQAANPAVASERNNRAVGINNRGDIVGQFLFDFGAGETTHAYHVDRPIGGLFTNTTPPDSGFARALGINGAGEIVGGYLDTVINQFRGFHLSGVTGGTPGTFTVFDVPFAGSIATQGTGINRAGKIVGIWNPDQTTFVGFHATGLGGTFTSITVPGSSVVQPAAITNRGIIVGDYNDAGGVGHGFMLCGLGGRLVTIDFPESIRTAIRGINNRGQLVGFYHDAQDMRHGFLATPSDDDLIERCNKNQLRRRRLSCVNAD